MLQHNLKLVLHRSTNLTGSNELDEGSLSLVLSDDLKGTLPPNKFFWFELDRLLSEIKI